MNELHLYCNRCKKPLARIRSVDRIEIINSCEALCAECSMIRSGAELMLKDNAAIIKELKEEIAAQNRLIVTGSFI
ncbi:MAG: hypothetical protein JXA71_19530 [Chitinispirillaceae bacterium]|nr:hypothetical protein [Chitinispirillaceae bacterium]